MKQQVDIVIVGGGMAGAALALALVQQTDWRIAVIDAAPAPAQVVPTPVINSRVVALNSASQQWLQDLGVWPAVAAARGCAYQHMQVWDGEGTGTVNFAAADLHVPALGHIVENQHLVACLWQALLATGRVQSYLGETVNQCDLPTQGGDLSKQDRLVLVTLASGTRLRAPLVVAADGAQSFIRQAAGIAIKERDYQHQAIVATLQTEFSHQSTAYQRFSHSGPLALLPLPSVTNSESSTTQHYVALVWSQQNAQAQTLMALNDDDFAQAVARASEHTLGAIKAVHHRAVIALSERHAEHYYRHGIVLIGDAAHTLHPLAGQGVNLGFADAKALAGELIRAHQRGLALSEPSIYSRYQRQRRLHNSGALLAMAGFKQFFEQQNPYISLLRNQGMQMFDRLPWLKKHAIKIAQGI